jgi:hypothetical protein
MYMTLKSPSIPLCQRGNLVPSLIKRGAGRYRFPSLEKRSQGIFEFPSLKKRGAGRFIIQMILLKTPPP